MTVAAPYFNRTNGPLLILLVLVMGIGPLLNWRKSDPKQLINKIIFPLIISLLIIFILLILIGVMLVGVFDKGSLKQLFSFLDMSQKNISRGLMFSLGTDLIISTYSIIDSVAVSLMNPLLYMNFVFGGGIFGLIFLIWRKEYNLSSIKTEMYSSWKLFLIGGICSCFAYILVLQAYTLSQVSYVAPFREIGVAFGVLLGYIALREKISYIKVLGVGSILVGAVIISLS